MSGLRILAHVDDVVLMASLGGALQLTLEQFIAECEAAGTRISMSNSVAMVLNRKRVKPEVSSC